MTNRNKFLKDLLGRKTQLNETDYKIYYVLYLGQVPNEAELDLIFSNSNFISRKDADAIILKKKFDKGSVILETFRTFDTDSKGYIDADDLRRTWEHTVPNLSWEILQSSFDQISEDGVLDYESFKIYFLSLPNSFN
ncbi:hypothetical protein FQR65_LT09274 [Abscondita terminalis]|nr:hypothetical protein FQR65_LT09274 [Abscondita terminalis]